MPRTLSPDDEKVIMKGLALQPFVAGALGFLLFPLSESAIVLGVLFAITATVITGCVAYPLLCRFITRGQLTLTRTIVSGAVLGNIPAAIAAVAVIVGSTDVVADLARLLLPVAVGSLVGAVSAAAFWALSGRHLKRAPRTTSSRGDDEHGRGGV